MGLLKRLFSIGSKKDKKKRPVIVHNVPVQDARVRPADDEDHEAAIGRLLRSSSARYAVAPEVDYASLPPLPHPINKVVQPPVSSTVSIASSSISQRGTYTVTIHGRKRHASTEFPHANRFLDDELAVPVRIPSASTPPEDDSRALRLRSDPSVLSLLDMYDEHGRLPSKAFSNSPPKERAQCRRNGSTLRQLLGAPTSLTSGDGEGDISWAERFLEDADSITSVSSTGLPTPNTSNAHFGDSFQQSNVHRDITISTDNDLSAAFDNPAISSMDVELSITTDSSRILEEPAKENSPYGSAGPATPQRASQIFGFLTDRRRRSKNLPDPPSFFSSPSDDGSSHHGFISRFSTDSSAESARPLSKDSVIPRSRSTSDTHRRSRRISTSSISIPMPLSRRSSRSDIAERPVSIVCTPRSKRDSFMADQTFDQTRDDDGEESNVQQAQKVKVIMTGPTKVIVTAPTPQTHHTPSRIPRGPRSQSRRISKEFKPARRMLTDYANSSGSEPALRGDTLTQLPSRRPARQRSASQTSTSTASLRENTTAIPRPAEKISKSRKDAAASRPTSQDKENQLRLTVKPDIPLTPLRTNSASANRSPLFRTAVSHGFFKPPAGMTPSPASSSELSPVGKQIMTDVRQQRLAAREADREKGIRYTKRSGSGKSAVRF